MQKNNTPEMSTLGKSVSYIDTYSPSLLFPIPRKSKRDEIGVEDQNLPFHGYDIWTGYELSWLNMKGRPEVAIALFKFPCESRCLVESKSFKLYLNSFNQTKFSSILEVKNTIIKDLSKACELNVEVDIYSLADEENIPHDFKKNILNQNKNFIKLDDLDIEIKSFEFNTKYLTYDESKNEEVEEYLCSNLLKSNCLVTGQPDWGSVYIYYKGKKISHEGLLRYIISFRQHNEFHEQCVERIFSDIMKNLNPEKLTVYARYTRRGGLDINPFRSNCNESLNISGVLIRQ